LSKSKIRAIDVWGTTLLSRIPLIITPMIRIIPVFQSFVIQSWQRYFVNGVYLASLVWFLILLFHAFKISCNLKNERLIASFITSMVLAVICTTIFIKLII
jgi:arginine exporter protein ArgO